MKNSKSHLGERGVAFLELAMVLPIVLTLIVGTMEMTQIINKHDEAIFFAQVASHKGFVDCTNRPLLSDPDPGAVTRCLVDNIKVPLQPVMDTDLAGVQLVVSVYEYNPVSQSIVLRGFRRLWKDKARCSDTVDNDGDLFIDAAADPDCSSPDWDLEDPTFLLPSRFNEARVANEFLPLIQKTRTLVIAEAILPQTILVPGLRYLTSTTGSSTYAISIS